MASMVIKKEEPNEDFVGITHSNVIEAVETRARSASLHSDSSLSDFHSDTSLSDFAESEGESWESDGDDDLPGGGPETTPVFHVQQLGLQTDSSLPPATTRHEWRGPPFTPVVRQPFSGPVPGPTTTMTVDKKESDFLALFISDTMLGDIVRETNRYAAQRKRLDQNWNELTVTELKAWLGLRVYMSVNHFPAVSDYWRSDWLFGNTSVPNIMKRDRFEKISQYFHLADVSKNPRRGEPGHDRLAHVRPILEGIRVQCLAQYNPHANMCVDEAMMAFCGRLALSPQKPTRYGIKVWVRADPHNGYVNDFQVYSGKHDANTNFPLATRVVLDMTQHAQHHNHIVNVNSFFSSPALFQQLLDHGIYARGTARTNCKHFPKDGLHQHHLHNQGDYKALQKGPLIAVAWKDKKVMHLLTTADNPAEIRTVTERRRRDGTR